MPDERTPADGQGAQEVVTQQGPDFERSYNELRPAYTQATQRLSEYEGLFAALHDPDPEVQAEALELLGLEPYEETGGPADEPDEFDDPLEKEVQELRDTVSELRERAELEANQANEDETMELRDDYIGEAITYIESSTNQKFSESEEEILGNLAIAMADEDNVPDVQGAYQRLYGEEGFLETRRQQWIDSKTGAAMPPLGRTIPADKKPQTAEERVNYMDERWRQLEDQQ